MYISYNWLKDFVKLSAKIKPEEIAAELTRRTVEIENLSKQSGQFDHVVVGRVLEVAKHPNADRLRLVKVDVKKEVLNIVCGAPNVSPGQLVPVAMIGAVLPDGLEIKESEIRGEKSFGMICAEDELGLGKNHEGIMVLSEKAKLGEPLAKYLKADDIILEVDNKSLSNRPDLLCHYGLARELAAIFNTPLKPYEKFFGKFEFLNAKENTLEVKVEDKELCPRYMAVKIENIEIKESPSWLKERLIAVGSHPINNIVDLTNYIMFDIGQPLHAFNADQIKKIVVRPAAKTEIIETLDENERNLNEGDLVITDGKKPIAVAGVMGGRNSEITGDTKAIILESANFSAPAIRKTAQRLNLRTEASGRYEKSLDPKLTEAAVFRFLSLLKEICPDFKIASSLVDIDHSDSKIKEIDLDLNWLAAKIGQDIPREQSINILEKLGFNIHDKQQEVLRVSVPSWRATRDINRREDLAEEILRLYGYDNIFSKLPVQEMALPIINQARLLERKIKNILALKFLLAEVYNYSFVGEEQLKKTKTDFSNYLRLANPLSGIQSLLRQSLVPGLIGNIKTNQVKTDRLGFFEIGSIFWPAPGDIKKESSGDACLPFQEKQLGIVLAGGGAEVFDKIKGVINNLFQLTVNYGVETEFLELENFPGWADRKMAAKIKLLEKEIGVVALVDSEVINNLNIKKTVAAAEINFSNLTELILNLPSLYFQEAPKYPPVIRDLAFVVDKKILYNDFKREIIKFNPLIKSAEIFDVYSGTKLDNDYKSLAFRLTYQSPEKTLTAGETDQIQTALIDYLAQKFEAKLRDF